MRIKLLSTCFCLAFLGATIAYASDKEAQIASAESAGPPAVTSKATIKASDGTILRKGSNGYTCYPQQKAMGPMCNEAVWDALIGAMMNKESFKADGFSVCDVEGHPLRAHHGEDLSGSVTISNGMARRATPRRRAPPP